jgi:hypothetical protein
MLCHGDIVEHEMKERKPVGKRFDVMTHEDLVRLLEGDAAPKEFEKACRPLVLDILENYEGFDAVEQAMLLSSKVPDSASTHLEKPRREG